MDRQFSYSDYNSEKVAFFIAANDQEIMHQVKRLMASNGYLGVTDTAGRLHYVVDGSKGTPYVSRRILEAAGQLLIDREQKDSTVLSLIQQAADTVLARYKMRPELNGFQYLRFMLVYVGCDQTKIKPITKTLYPLVAERFHVTVSQVERDIRYALASTALKERYGLTAGGAFCRLQQELTHLVNDKQIEIARDSKRPSVDCGKNREPY